MKVIEDMVAWRKLRRDLDGSIGFVPTMGALHDGHASLMQQSVAANDITVLSIYINPTQFNDPKDLANYPETLEADLAIAQDLGVDYVIMPRYADMYADGYRYQVAETKFSNELCGSNRPGHFTGVLTVVMKLINLVGPQRAYFGKKDYQQYVLVQDMCKAFLMDVEIIGCDIIRECDGLALSSRNKLLNARARCQASAFNSVLRKTCSDERARAALIDLGVDVDYVETRDDRRFGAIVVDCGEKSVRLIDNVGLAG